MRQQPLARRGRAQRPIAAVEQLDAEQLLEPLQLLADGGLREVQQVRRAGDAAGLDDCNERTQQSDIDVS